MAIATIALVSYLGIISALFGFASIRFWLILNRLEGEVPFSVSSVLAGRQAMLVGHVAAPFASLVESPYSQHKCICFAAATEQKTAHFDAQRGFAAPYWEKLGTSIRSAPFILTDQSGSLFVIASRAQISLTQTFAGELDVQHRFKSVKRGMQWFARRIAPTQTIWVRESLLREGDVVFVSGVAQPISPIDMQLIPEKFRPNVKFVLKGTDVCVSKTVPAANIPFYEKCFWFCAVSTGACLTLLIALLVLF